MKPDREMKCEQVEWPRARAWPHSWGLNRTRDRAWTWHRAWFWAEKLDRKCRRGL